ncbi:DUF4345 domain-containing protein [Gordonia sp. DT30]|uniref:DUF4345 domain-containing protein n=1 Tax=unclassified Gordonia (in: high G+C Gram-positive bacteria) TaxID=2657482 RepID=UPI003CED2079
MLRAFRVWLVIFGSVVLGIALAHLFFGQTTYIGGGTVDATMESDLRFFNILFAAYGLGFVWAAQDVPGRARVVDLLGLLFFLGGLARLLAWVTVGTPSWFYLIMTPVELIVPVVNHFLLRAVTKPAVGGVTV